MATKNIEINIKNSTNTYDQLYPKTNSSNIIMSEGENLDEYISSDRQYKVGDTLTTARPSSDFNNEWMVCDGSEVPSGYNINSLLDISQSIRESNQNIYSNNTTMNTICFKNNQIFVENDNFLFAGESKIIYFYNGSFRSQDVSSTNGGWSASGLVFKGVWDKNNKYWIIPVLYNNQILFYRVDLGENCTISLLSTSSAPYPSFYSYHQVWGGENGVWFCSALYVGTSTATCYICYSTDMLNWSSSERFSGLGIKTYCYDDISENYYVIFERTGVSIGSRTTVSAYRLNMPDFTFENLGAISYQLQYSTRDFYPSVIDGNLYLIDGDGIMLVSDNTFNYIKVLYCGGGFLKKFYNKIYLYAGNGIYIGDTIESLVSVTTLSPSSMNYIIVFLPSEESNYIGCFYSGGYKSSNSQVLYYKMSNYLPDSPNNPTGLTTMIKVN